MRLIVGLGNPGKEYEGTRHNAGASLAQEIARAHSVTLKKHRTGALAVRYMLGETSVVLATPLSYMNESGPVVAALSRYFHIAPEDTIVLYDDLDLPFGTLRVSTNETSGGHKGVQSVIDAFGSSAFQRVRIGIGPQQGPAEEYVLRPWSQAQKNGLHDILTEAHKAVELLIQEGLTEAASQYN